MTRPSTRRLRILVVAVAAACATPLVTQAQSTPPAPTAQPDAPRPPMPPHARPHGMERDLDRLKTSLRLDGKQTALWDRAAARMKPPADAREAFKARREHVNAMLDDPNFDPKKLAAEMDQEQAKRDAEMKDRRDAWITVYESLNPVQRGQVREYMRGRLARGPFFGPGPAMWMHGGPHGHGPRPEGMPTPPAPPAPPSKG